MREELPGTAFGRGFFKNIHLIQVATFILPTSLNFEKIRTHHTMDPYIQHQAIPQLTLDVATWTSSHRFPGRLSHPHNGYHRPRASKGAVVVPRFCRAHVEDTTSPRSWNQSSHSLDPQTEGVPTWNMIIRCIKYTKRQVTISKQVEVNPQPAKQRRRDKQWDNRGDKLMRTAHKRQARASKGPVVDS